MGNVHSVKSAISFLGYDAILSDDKKIISEADYLILPGVGEFSSGIKNLKDSGLSELIIEIHKNKNARILGICLGMQLLCLSSDEGSYNSGLGLIKGHVERFNSSKNIRIPHVGFNEVKLNKDSVLGGWSDESIKDFYFVHSHRINKYEDKEKPYISMANYGDDFIAIYEKENLFATQFHPEKSQTNGLNLLYNFIEK